jgi:ATP-dependent DNA helicase RecG
MNIERLLQRIRLGEDSTLELKEIRVRPGGKGMEPHADGLSDELAALGNASGGTLVLGVDDKTKAVTGIPLEHLDSVEAWLTAICTDRIRPALDLVTRHLELPGPDGEPRAVIVAEVPRSLWVHESANGYFRRVGHAKRKLTPDGLARLFQQRSQARLIRFEEQEVPGAPVDEPLFGKGQLMDRREALSGKRPVYENLDDMELLLTIYAAPAPEGTGAGTHTPSGLDHASGQGR